MSVLERLRPPGGRALQALARLHGIEPSYIDVGGTRHEAGAETIVALLAAMDVPVAHPEDAKEVLAAERARQGPFLEPILVQWSERPAPVAATIPRHLNPRTAWLTMELENGESHRRRLASALVPGGTAEVRAGKLGGTCPISLCPPGEQLPPGYHRLSVEAPGLASSSLVIVAPRCPEPDRSWGAFLPLHALRTEGDWGIGRYDDLADLRAWLEGLGGAFVGTLPLYPAYLEGPLADPSPYLPVTRLGWNEVYVDPEALPELAIAAQARDLLGSPAFQIALAARHRAPIVDHAAVMTALRSVLEPMAQALFARPSERRDQLETFLAERPHVAEYARFRAERSAGGPGEAFRRATEYHLYTQWVAESQLAAAAQGERGSGLYLDLPVGVHPDGFDPVFEPDAFVPGVHGGAPPDAFFAGGQDWGFPPMHPERARAQEYRHFIATLRHLMSHASLVRIDHVMGLRRLYWIPGSTDPSQGAYVRYRHEELRAVVALEAWRAGTAVVGEDLGTVPRGVRSAMDRDHMLRSWVLQFEVTADEPLPDPPRRSLAGWGTHDLPRFATFFVGTDIDERQERGDITPPEADAERTARARWRESVSRSLKTPAPRPGEVLAGCLFHLAAGPALATMVDLEDLWLEERPQNQPGTGTGAQNWRRRAALSLEELRKDAAVGELLAGVDERRRMPAAGRGGGPASGHGRTRDRSNRSSR